jgi:hypothetical protein
MMGWNPLNKKHQNYTDFFIRKRKRFAERLAK